MYAAWIVATVVFFNGPVSSVPRAQDSLPKCPWPGPAQFLKDRLSPPDSVVFSLGSVAAKICYSRPSMRGRPIFGELVEYGKRWRTGANEPTMLHLTIAAEVAGVLVRPGTYVLMTIPGPERWTVLLSTSAAPTPMEMFNALVEVGRGEVLVEALDAPVEQFTIRAAGDSARAELILEWERVRIRIPVAVAR